MRRSAWSSSGALGTSHGFGGYRQQSSELTAVALPQTSPSGLCLCLLEDVGWGHITPSGAGRLVRAVISDGIRKAMLDKLGSIGAGGKRIQNSRRDLIRRFCKNIQIPKLMKMTVYFKRKNKTDEPMNLSFLSPYQLMDCIYEHHRDLFP